MIKPDYKTSLWRLCIRDLVAVMCCWQSLCSIAWFAAMSAAQETLSDTPQNSTPLLATTVSTTKVISFRPRYPYIVSIGENLKGYYKHLCVGVILSNEFVLSAAHCIQTNPTKQLYVAGGADSLNSRKQTRFFVVERRWHPQFRCSAATTLPCWGFTPNSRSTMCDFVALTLLESHKGIVAPRPRWLAGVGLASAR